MVERYEIDLDSRAWAQLPDGELRQSFLFYTDNGERYSGVAYKNGDTIYARDPVNIERRATIDSKNWIHCGRVKPEQVVFIEYNILATRITMAVIVLFLILTGVLLSMSGA